ncbi:anti-sigma factor [Acrocarpospora sp. B8E8]|uniref:anti-sigma factor n=1 Tax=Acrocarpospora sp. B8E8 TaxID=3153572 RepID=UPI00325EEA5A
MNDDLHTLSGAYALNALPHRDQGLFEEHLARCEACADEVRGLRETVARLAAGVAEPPPLALKRRVLAEIAQVRQEPPRPVRTERANVVPLAPRWRSRLAVGLAAASVAAAVTVGVVAVNTVQQRDRTLEETQQLLAATQNLLAAPDAVVRRVPMTGGGGATIVLSPHQGKLMFASDMPGLPSGQTYQMWLIGPTGIHSAGLVDGGGGVRTATLAVPGEAERFGVTVEPAGGSRQPTTTPILLTKLA